MTDELKYDQLEMSINSVLLRGEAPSTGDEEIDALARLASGLRWLPDPQFKTRVRGELLQDSQRDSSQGLGNWIRSLPGISWFKGQHVFLAGGSSFGLVAGTCCVSGATVHMLGLSSAAAVTTFIHSTIPYFIALSIVSMLAWLAWLLREQGITPVTIGRTLRQHGFALGGSYAAVFGATMSLSMLMGLY